MKMEKEQTTLKVMSIAPVIPVVTVSDVTQAVNLGKALVAGGLPSIEVTLRTPEAIDAIGAIHADVEGALVGAGTVLDARQVDAVTQAGAVFMVSPGFSPDLLSAAKQCPIPLLPGVSTASEAMQLGGHGYKYLKFFPAGPAGGPDFIKSISAPLPQFKFCPTGGVNLMNAPDYLKLSNVICVGGSWVAPVELIDAGDWDGITKLAKQASQMSE